MFLSQKKISSVSTMVEKRHFISTCLSLILLAVMGNVLAQEKNSDAMPRVSIDVKGKSFREVLLLIEQQVPYRFAYDTELIAKQRSVKVNVENKSLDELFDILLRGTNLTYSLIDNQIILTETQPLPTITVSGYVKDSLTGETLPGAVIYLPQYKTGTYANDYGFFSITQSPNESLEVVVSYVGFNKISRRINASNNSSMNLFLTGNNVELNTVLITDKKADDNIRKHFPGTTDISIDLVKALPSINGNGDIINSIQMMPGVMAGLDGRPGYFIRGGNTDQNLVQLDEATLYNPNHLLGLVGIFNSSAIKSAYLLKAGFPASFGDHLSSVLDVTMKDGNDQQFNGDIQVGTIASGFTFSGPLVMNKASFFVAARRSIIDLILKPFNVSDYYSNYYFNDINSKLNFKITPRDRLYVSFYQGRDYSSYSRDTVAKNDIDYRVNYGNRAFTFRWNHLFSQKLFINTSLTYNNYFHSVKARQQQYYAELYSGIRDVEIKTDLYFYPNQNHKVATGVNYLFQTLYPASITDRSSISEADTSLTPSKIPDKTSGRIAAYFSDEITFGNKFSAYVGVRIPFFYNKETNYLQFEPRMSLMYLANPTTSVKISYTQMHQYLHLVQSFNSSFPAQIWIGSSEKVKPQFCHETSLGLFKNFRENMFQTSLEVYYKKMGNQLMFRGGADPAINSNIENTLIFGEGQSYGAEVFVGKNTGKLTGWLAYTLSYSKQKFDSLNLGREFPFANDRRHVLSLSASYAIAEHWQISTNFTYSSGSAFSVFQNIPPNKWTYDNPLYYYSGSGSHSISSARMVQNNFRLAPYHRLDLGISYHNVRRIFNRDMETEWVLSVYNVYARENTFFAYCSIDPVTKEPIAVEISFVPVIPSLSWNLKF